jgi:chromate transporter
LEVAPPVLPSFREARRVWWRIALGSFGGPAGQIALMHRVLVDERRWLSEARFLHALSYCTLLPGPEAQQLATYSGWLLHGTRGGIVAGGLFVLPGFLAILALSVLYVTFGHTAWRTAAFAGLKPAVLAIVVEAVVRLGRRALHTWGQVAIAAGAFAAIFFLAMPFPLILLVAAGLGLLLPAAEAPAPGGSGRVVRDVSPTLGRTLGIIAAWGLVWSAPVVLLLATLGWAHVLTQQAVFFSKVAMVTFGGAYAVLAYVAQQAVETYGWLRPGEMLDGLGMAETTPGPLIQVVQFVAFLGAHRDPAPFSPLGAAVLASVVTTWVTYAPCFLWIFAGAPYVEALRRSRVVSRALAGIMAAVVGVILNLSVWFALHVLFAEVDEVWWGPWRLWLPLWRSLDPVALGIAAVAAFAILRAHWSMGRTLALSVGLGLLRWVALPA